MSKQPAVEAINIFQNAYNLFNQALFEAQLPPCMIIYQRKGRAFGYYAPKRWEDREAGGRLDEIAINPDMLDGNPDMEAAQTLLHEMVHLWQRHFGKPSRNGYHNKEFALKMQAVGLMPSDTGKVGGKRTGQRMSDYPIDNGRFMQLWPQVQQLGFKLRYVGKTVTRTSKGGMVTEGESGESAKAKSKVKFGCPFCGQNAWGRPSLNLLCGSCSDSTRLVAMEEIG